MSWILGAYGLMSAVTLITYGVDKTRARRGAWRVRESTLHLLAVGGGIPGALLAQSLFRHKTRKAAFLAITWLIAAGHAAAWSWWLIAR